MTGGPVHLRPDRSHRPARVPGGRRACRTAPSPGAAGVGRRASVAGGPPSDGLLIETHQAPGGARVSTIRRMDGSTFTVSVPAAAMNDEAAGSDGSESWISAEGRCPEPPPSALARLAALVAPDAARRPAARLGPAALAVP